MKNDDIGRALNRELSGIRLGPEARARIVRRAKAACPKPRRGFTAAAAAAVLLLALGGALCFRLINRPDTPDNVAAHGGAGTPSPAPTISARSDDLIDGMWVADGCGTFHLYQACIISEYENVHIKSVEKDGALTPCPICLADCYWLDLDSGEYHTDIRCEKAGRIAPIRGDLTDSLGYTPCAACAYSEASDQGIDGTVSEANPESSYGPIAEEYETKNEQLQVGGEDEEFNGVINYPENAEYAFGLKDDGAAFIGKYDQFTLSLNSWAARSVDDLDTYWIKTSNTAVYTGEDEVSESNIGDVGLDYCWCTETGLYIHSIGNCSRMKNSFTALAAPACKNGAKLLCPECGDGIGCVYYADDSACFHADPDCGGMKNSIRHTRREAYAAGKEPCETCLEYEAKHPVE